MQKSESSRAHSERIAQLNDRLRQTFWGGKVMITPMVQALPDDTRAALFQAVSTFDDFDWRNDPRGEHDFGKVEVADAEYFWKIDYYAPCMKRGSEDPSDPACTERVLTIMATCEY